MAYSADNHGLNRYASVNSDSFFASAVFFVIFMIYSFVFTLSVIDGSGGFGYSSVLRKVLIESAVMSAFPIAQILMYGSFFKLRKAARTDAALQQDTYYAAAYRSARTYSVISVILDIVYLPCFCLNLYLRIGA